jgi:hypothetical protein
MISYAGDGVGIEGFGLYPLASVPSMAAWHTSNAGNHSHSVDLPYYAGTSGATTVVPPYVGLLKLCRIR